MQLSWLKFFSSAFPADFSIGDFIFLNVSDKVLCNTSLKTIKIRILVKLKTLKQIYFKKEHFAKVSSLHNNKVFRFQSRVAVFEKFPNL